MSGFAWLSCSSEVAASCRGPRFDTEAFKDVFEVFLYGGAADPECACDLCVGQSFETSLTIWY